MATIKKLYFSSGVDVTAPSDLSLASSTVSVNEYANDAAFVSANGTATAGDLYINSTLRALRLYTGSAWRTVIMSTDDADATKTFLVDIDGATTGTAATLDFNQTASRTYTFPDSAGIVVLNSNTEASPTIFSGATGTTTIGNASGTVVFNGNVTVSGTTTTVNSTTVDVADKNITVSKGGNDAASEGAGLTVDRTSTKGSFIYKDASASKFAIGAQGAEVDVVSTSATQTLSNKTIASPTVTGTLLLQNPSGAQPELALSEDPDNGTNKVVIKAPATLASDYTLTLPENDGDSNQFLRTDGSGVLSWVSSSTSAPYAGQATDTTVAAGNIGEKIESKATGGTITSTAANLTSINLTAGIWLIYAQVSFKDTGYTTFEISVNTTSATHGTLGDNRMAVADDDSNGWGGATIAGLYAALSGTTTYYLVASCSNTQTNAAGYRLTGIRIA